MSMLIILEQMLVITALALIGFGVYKANILDAVSVKRLSALVIDICNPALALSCVIQDRLNATHGDVIKAVVCAAVIYTVLILLGLILPRLLRVPGGERRFYHMMSVYANTGFIGIPVAKAVLSSDAMIYVIIFNVMFNVFFYTHGMYVMGGGSGERRLPFLNAGLICGVLTILIFWFDISIPEIPADIIIYVGNANTFLSMVLLGASFAVVSIRQIFVGSKMYIYLAVRQFCVPLILGRLLILCGMNIDMVRAFTLLMAMPAANMPLMLAEKNGEDTSLISRGILLTTIMAPITVTLVMGLL